MYALCLHGSRDVPVYFFFSFHFNGKILNSYAKSNNSNFDIDKSHFPFHHHTTDVDGWLRRCRHHSNKNNNKRPLPQRIANINSASFRFGFSYFTSQTGPNTGTFATLQKFCVHTSQWPKNNDEVNRFMGMESHCKSPKNRTVFMTFRSIFGYFRECLVKQTFISEIIEHLMETYVLIDGYLFIYYGASSLFLLLFAKKWK